MKLCTISLLRLTPFKILSIVSVGTAATLAMFCNAKDFSHGLRRSSLKIRVCCSEMSLGMQLIREESSKSLTNLDYQSSRIRRHLVCFFKLLLMKSIENLHMSGPPIVQCAGHLPIYSKLDIKSCNVLLELGRVYIWDPS